MATYPQAKNVFVALSSFLNLEEEVHAEPSNPGEVDGYIERTLTVGARLIAKGDVTLRFTLTTWDDAAATSEWFLFHGFEDVAFSDISRFHGLTQEQGAVIRALLR